MSDLERYDAPALPGRRRGSARLREADYLRREAAGIRCEIGRSLHGVGRCLLAAIHPRNALRPRRLPATLGTCLGIGLVGWWWIRSRRRACPCALATAPSARASHHVLRKLTVGATSAIVGRLLVAPRPEGNDQA